MTAGTARARGQRFDVGVFDELGLLEPLQDQLRDAVTAARGAFGITGVLAWAAVGVPFLIGLYIALAKAAALF